MSTLLAVTGSRGFQSQGRELPLGRSAFGPVSPTAPAILSPGGAGVRALTMASLMLSEGSRLAFGWARPAWSA